MTKGQLEQFRSNQAEILELEHKLAHLGEDDSLIRSSVILDYRNGYGVPQAVVGYDRELETRYRKRYEKLLQKLRSECEDVDEFINQISDGIVRRIFRMRYIDGMSQERIALKVHIDKSNVSRKIDNYLKVATHATKATV